MGLCRETKANGEACKAPATGPHGYCWGHAPEHAEKRRRMASKAARAKPNREIKDVKAILSDLTTRVLGGEGVEPLEAGRAAVANQLLNTRLRALEQERKIKETEALEARIEALERSQGRGGGRWGA